MDNLWLDYSNAVATLTGVDKFFLLDRVLGTSLASACLIVGVWAFFRAMQHDYVLTVNGFFKTFGSLFILVGLLLSVCTYNYFYKNAEYKAVEIMEVESTLVNTAVLDLLTIEQLQTEIDVNVKNLKRSKGELVELDLTVNGKLHRGAKVYVIRNLDLPTGVLVVSPEQKANLFGAKSTDSKKYRGQFLADGELSVIEEGERTRSAYAQAQSVHSIDFILNIGKGE